MSDHLKAAGLTLAFFAILAALTALVLYAPLTGLGLLASTVILGIYVAALTVVRSWNE